LGFIERYFKPLGIHAELPKTTINFDPFLPATFELEERSMGLDLLPDSLKVLTYYGQGLSFEGIRKKMDLKQRVEVRRLLQRGCKEFVTLLHEPSVVDKFKTDVT
jgi:hypothetical protein